MISFPLDVRTELRIDGAWSDVTDDVRDGISITRGRQNEATSVDAATAGITFNNRDGRYSPRNPLSPLYGKIGRNTPVRVSVRDSGTWLSSPARASGVVASTPDASALDVTGDLDVRADLASAMWRPSATVDVAGRYLAAGDQRCWALQLTAAGLVQLLWSPNGTFASRLTATSTTAVPAGPARRAIRAALDVNNGSAGWTCTFYTANTAAGPWTQLGSAVTAAGVTSVYGGTVPLEVGDVTVLDGPFEGRIYSVELLNGIGGTAVANPNFAAQAAGTTSFSDAAGRTWTIAAPGEITDRHVRFHGEISAWPPTWDLSGNDVYTQVEAAGIMRRLKAAGSVLKSPMTRYVSGTAPVAYWPAEDESGASMLYSPVDGVRPLTVSGLSLAADDSLPASLALPTIAAAGRISGRLPAMSSTEWSVWCVFRVASDPGATPLPLLSVRAGGTVVTWTLVVSSIGLGMTAVDSSGTDLVGGGANTLKWGTWYMGGLCAKVVGGTVTRGLGFAEIDGGIGSSITFSTFAGSLGPAREISTLYGATAAEASLGHIVAYNAYDPGITWTGLPSEPLATNAFVFEAAADRVARLTGEEAVPVVLRGAAADQVLMGAQGASALLDLLGEAGDADGGILAESITDLALSWRGHDTLFNQLPVMTIPYDDVPAGLQPVEDDQSVRNDVTASRPSGSSSRAEVLTGPLSVLPPPDGVGRYESPVTVNVAEDRQLPDAAWWRAHQGTWDEARYPSVPLNLYGTPAHIDAFLLVEVGDRLVVPGMPVWSPGDVDQLIQGWSETLGQFDWDVVFNTTPARPWDVATVDDDELLGHIDTDGTELAADVDAADTTFTVTVTDGPPWTVDPADFPFAVMVGGEEMTVTAISGTSNPQTFTVTRSLVKDHAAGTDVRLAYPAIVAY